jgi:hypothetical protein
VRIESVFSRPTGKGRKPAEQASRLEILDGQKRTRCGENHADRQGRSVTLDKVLSLRWMARDVSLPVRILDEISELDLLAANMIAGNLDDLER